MYKIREKDKKAQNKLCYVYKQELQWLRRRRISDMFS